jgi:hypothetical protein
VRFCLLINYIINRDAQREALEGCSPPGKLRREKYQRGTKGKIGRSSPLENFVGKNLKVKFNPLPRILGIFRVSPLA